MAKSCVMNLGFVLLCDCSSSREVGSSNGGGSGFGDEGFRIWSGDIHGIEDDEENPRLGFRDVLIEFMDYVKRLKVLKSS